MFHPSRLPRHERGGSELQSATQGARRAQVGKAKAGASTPEGSCAAREALEGTRNDAGPSARSRPEVPARLLRNTSCRPRKRHHFRAGRGDRHVMNTRPPCRASSSSADPSVLEPWLDPWRIDSDPRRHGPTVRGVYACELVLITWRTWKRSRSTEPRLTSPY